MEYTRSVEDLHSKISAIVYYRERTTGVSLLDSKRYVEDFVENISGDRFSPWKESYRLPFSIAVRTSAKAGHWRWLQQEVARFNETHGEHYKLRK